MEPEDIKRRLAEIDTELKIHIERHHSGLNAGVLKLTKCQVYKDLMAESFVLRNEWARLRKEE